MKEAYDVISRRFRFELQTVIVTDLLPNLFPAAGGTHLGAAAPTLELFLTLSYESGHLWVRDPGVHVPWTRNDARSTRSLAG